MTLEQALAEVRLLGFETGGEVHLEDEVVYAAVNRAICMIAAEVRPLTGDLTLQQEGETATLTGGKTVSGEALPGGLHRYDCRELAALCGDDRFLCVSGIHCRLPGGETAPIEYWELEADRFLVVSQKVAAVTLRYERLVPCLTPQDPGDTPLPLDEEVHPLVPLLAGFYAWLDDDERKALLYYNEYADRAAVFKKRTRGATARVTGGRLSF